jgi:acetyltransferase
MLSVVDLDKEIPTRDGQRLRLRPIEADDDEALVEFARLCTPEDLRLRFLGAIRAELGSLSTLLTHYDHDRQVAVAAYDPAAPAGPRAILAVVRLIRAEDDAGGEVAIIVRSDLKGQGLGRALFARALEWARALGLQRVYADVLPENRVMLRLIQSFGGVAEPERRDPYSVRVWLDLETSVDPV